MLEHLALKGTPLEVCPTSNVRTRQVASIDAHPVRRMVDAGVTVTLEGEYLGRAVARLAENAVLASFLPNARKTLLLEEIASVLAAK